MNGGGSHTAGKGSGSGGNSSGNDGGAQDGGATGGSSVGGSASSGKSGSGAGGDARGGGAGSSANGGTTSGSGTGAAAGETGDPEGPDRDDHTPLATVPECLQPTHDRDMAPPTEVHLGGTWLRESERDCIWTVGEPVYLPLEADDPGELLFQLDVNGDHVDDLIFGSHAIGTSTASGRSLVLVESKLEDGELSYERSSCGTPWDISYRSFYARDLDRDGTSDFVIGRVNGISAQLNKGGERPEVLHFDWPPGSTVDAWASILDVAVGDFDADGRDDIAVGYDRATGENDSTIETGVLLFRDRSAQGTYGAPETLAKVPLNLLTSFRPNNFSMPAGLLASVPRPDGTSALFSLFMLQQPDGPTGFQYEGGQALSFLAPSATFGQPIVARGVRFAGESTLAIGGPSSLALVRPSAPYDSVETLSLSFAHPSDHELGGGNRIRSVFLLDIDGDGDEDVVERGSVNGYDPWPFWIQNRISEGVFGEAAMVQGMHESSKLLESPFVRAGVFPGRLFVRDGIPPTPPQLFAIACSGS
ncbi:MAG TPA: VCBS repeat-containing protein [Polyangiaceae bacterium]|nr:VCBS repeat-containing protein [Polyangiaceae bacterium]